MRTDFDKLVEAAGPMPADPMPESSIGETINSLYLTRLPIGGTTDNTAYLPELYLFSQPNHPVTNEAYEVANSVETHAVRLLVLQALRKLLV